MLQEIKIIDKTFLDDFEIEFPHIVDNIIKIEEFLN